MRQLRLRWAATCTDCRTTLAAGTTAWWDSSARCAYCIACGDPRAAPDADASIDSGIAGTSARREYDRRATSERKRQELAVERDVAWREHLVQQKPVIGRIKSALTPRPAMTGPSRSARAWETGAQGEERVAEILSGSNVVSLHDRRIPGTKSNIDHFAVSTGGVFVIDAKKYVGEIEVRDLGPLWRRDPHLYIGGRDRTKLVHAMHRQMDVVRGALAVGGHRPPVRGVLCFVGAEWPLVFRRPLNVDGVTAVWPLGLPKVFEQPDAAGVDVDIVARILADSFPPA